MPYGSKSSFSSCIFNRKLPNIIKNTIHINIHIVAFIMNIIHAVNAVKETPPNSR